MSHIAVFVVSEVSFIMVKHVLGYGELHRAPQPSLCVSVELPPVCFSNWTQIAPLGLLAVLLLVQPTVPVSLDHCKGTLQAQAKFEIQQGFSPVVEGENVQNI